MQKVFTEGHHVHKSLHTKLDFQTNMSRYKDLHSKITAKVQSSDMAELKFKVDSWRAQRMASMRNEDRKDQNVNERGELRNNIDLEAEHK